MQDVLAPKLEPVARRFVTGTLDQLDRIADQSNHVIVGAVRIETSVGDQQLRRRIHGDIGNAQRNGSTEDGDVPDVGQ